MPKQNTILIVDDDKFVIEQLQSHFRRRNYEPIATANPEIVEDTLKTFQVQLILLDLKMERLDGYDVLKKLKDKNINIPVLIITAFYNGEKERLKSVGITEKDVIHKPFRDFAPVEAKINQKLSRIVAPEEVGTRYENEIYYSNRTKMIIVDDEKEITEMLADIFRERKYEVKTFEDGDEALAYISSNPGGCHIAIIDMKIPGLNGPSLMKEIRKILPQVKLIPVSASNPEQMGLLLEEIGMDPKSLVTKPLHLETFVEQMKVIATEIGTLGDAS